MRLPLYQIDAFASDLFRGNAAAVCPLESWLPDPILQAIAAENNLSETAFYVPENGRYRLRWFTPTFEIDLCGHATVAAAAVILDLRREIAGSRIVFDSLSGELSVDRDGDRFVLDFPARRASERPVDPELASALGATPQRMLSSKRDCICVFESADQIRRMSPDMNRLRALEYFAVAPTAPGDDCDYVLRFFAPRAGINEDPATGSVHTSLTPFWAGELGKSALFARQLSARGAEFWCENRGERVKIGGCAVKYLEGHIEVPHKSVTDSKASAS